MASNVLSSAEMDPAEQAAPLDALLVDAAPGPLRRFTPDASTARRLGRLARHPRRTGRRFTDHLGGGGLTLLADVFDPCVLAR
jgi:hypothetical protein